MRAAVAEPPAALPPAPLLHVSSRELRSSRSASVRAWYPGPGCHPGRCRSPPRPYWVCSCPSGVCRRMAPGAGSSHCPGTRPLCRTQRTAEEKGRVTCSATRHPGAPSAARSPDRGLGRGSAPPLPLPSLSPGPRPEAGPGRAAGAPTSRVRARPHGCRAGCAPTPAGYEPSTAAPLPLTAPGDQLLCSGGSAVLPEHEACSSARPGRC